MNQDFVGEKEEELMGGLKNALNKGETLESASRSFINAGYPENIVRMAANRLSQNFQSPATEEITPSQVNIPSSNLNLYAQRQPQNYSKQQSYPQQSYPQQSYPQQQAPRSNSSVPYWVIILMLLLSIGIIIGAGILGLYWHKLFPGY